MSTLRGRGVLVSESIFVAGVVACMRADSNQAVRRVVDGASNSAAVRFGRVRWDGGAAR